VQSRHIHDVDNDGEARRQTPSGEFARRRSRPFFRKRSIVANFSRNRETPGALPDELLATCQAGALRAGWSLSRALGIAVRLSVEDVAGLASRLKREATRATWLSGPGLMVLMPVEQQAAAFVVGAWPGGLPAWLARPDGLERGRLSAMAQELGTSLLPRQFGARGCAAGYVPQLGAALARGGCSAAAICVEMSLEQSSSGRARALLVWPLDQPATVFATEAVASPKTSVRDTGELSHVKLDVSVVVAQKRESVRRIVQLTAGDVLRFDKSHRAPLELQVDGRRVAAGQCVEIGRRLGLVITSS
jgi:flagellar motor switch/type III secretory pathway protein FliN